MLRVIAASMLVAGFAITFPSAAHAINRSWDSGGANDLWGNTLNWSPNGNPDGDDLTIGDLLQGMGAQTIVNQDISIASLTLEAGASADTNGRQLDVNGATSLSEAGTTLLVRDYDDGTALSPQAVLTDTLFVGSGATVEMYDDAVLEVNDGLFTLFGTLIGNGELQLDDFSNTPTSLFNNSGTLSVGLPGISLAPPPRTLRITAQDADARIDLDGNGTGQVFLQQNATLDINVQLSEPFSGTMSLGPNSTLDVEDSWELDGTINVDTSQPALTETATITGAQLTLASGAAIVLDEIDEQLRIDAQLSANNGSTLANTGEVIFDAPAQFGAMADFQMNGGAPRLVVNSDVTIAQDSFDIDGAGFELAEVTVNEGASLTLNVEDFGGGDDKADGTININSGEMVVDFSFWFMDGTLNLNNTNGTPAVLESGFTLNIGDNVGSSDANIVVGEVGESQIHATFVDFFNGADVDIGAGAVLNIDAVTTFFEKNVTVDGEGTFKPGRLRVRADTTLNVAVVDLEGNVTPGGMFPHDITDAVLTINADAIDDDADGFDSDLLIVSNEEDDVARLEVNVPGGWAFDSGTITIESGAVGDADAITVLSGSPIQLGVEGGTLEVTGNTSRSTARLEVFGTININTEEDDGFILAGGSGADPNRMMGGSIGGSGKLFLGSNRSMHGFGDISVDIDADPVGVGNGELLADDGTLTVTGNVIELDVIGVTDDGVLDVTNPWSTDVINDEVFLDGGEITGATITNEAGQDIRGHGLISARVINNGEIRADGGTLTLEPLAANNDYDGTTSNGVLVADGGDLVLRRMGGDTGLTLFSGTLQANPESEIRVDFRLSQLAGGVLTINDGTFRASERANLFGSVTVNGTEPSRIVSENNSADEYVRLIGDITLNANLELDTATAILDDSVSFSGTGSLFNLDGSSTQLTDGVELDVPIVNHGQLRIGNELLGDNDLGGVDLTAFTQTSTGELQIDLNGLIMGQFDTILVQQNAVLNGTLTVNLLGTFTPVLGNSFTILETTIGNVGGEFAVENMPEFNDLTLDVVYDLKSVVLEVVEVVALPGDYYEDGVVNAADYVVWRNNQGTMNELPNDPIGGEVGAAQYDQWVDHFGETLGGGSAIDAVPEPASAVLLVLSGLGSLATWRRYAN